MEDLCLVADCKNPSRTLQLCPKHYQSLRSKGYVAISKTETLTRDITPCSVDGCTKGAMSNSMCGTHYGRWYRNGDPLLAFPADKPPLTTDQRFWNKVQRTDGCWLWTGNTDEYGKGKFQFDGKVRSAHRYSYMKHYGVKLGKGELLRQTCKVPECVNPAHLKRASEAKAS